MDKGRLEKLQAQAKAATELAARLQILQANDPKSSRFRVRMEDGALGNLGVQFRTPVVESRCADRARFYRPLLGYGTGLESPWGPSGPSAGERSPSCPQALDLSRGWQPGIVALKKTGRRPR